MTKTLIPEHTLSDLDMLAKIKAGTHVLVPVEPTEAMEDAGEAIMRQYGLDSSPTQCEMLDLYEAMIKAAAQEGK